MLATANQVERQPTDVGRWLEEYQRFMQVPLFLEAYRAEQRRRGKAPQQNFLIGSELMGHNEVEWCKALAWLLNPQSERALAMRFQRKLCKLAGVALESSHPAFDVARELFHPDGASRYDIQLKRNNRVFLIETKVGAPVEKEQLERYCQENSQYDFRGLLVTLDDYEEVPLTNWQYCRWHHIAEHLGELLREVQNDSTGASKEERRWVLIAEDFVDLISQE